MKNALTMIAALAALAFSSGMTRADEAKTTDDKKSNTKTVGGAEMSPEKNIVENGSQSKDHTTLVAAVKAAGLVETLSGKGPFTVFAPTNEAFEALPDGTVDTLLKPENKEKLTSILTYHVLSGTFDARVLTQGIMAGNGQTTVKTINGNFLTVKMDGDKVALVDGAGNTAHVTIADVRQSNGVIHVIDKVLMPSK